jgi:hypothetical protein
MRKCKSKEKLKETHIRGKEFSPRGKEFSLSNSSTYGISLALPSFQFGKGWAILT